MKNYKLCVLTGSGISAESGLRTFRDSGGLWENHRIEDVATPEAFARNPQLVNNFYNLRRRQCLEALPNAAHIALAEMERVVGVEVIVITQNVDDLHERAGSSQVVHLHGSLLRARSTGNSSLRKTITGDLTDADLAPDGHPWRPDIVWFGEPVPELETAWQLISQCDELWVVGTSLQVYPAASLVHAVPEGCTITVCDPDATVAIQGSARVLYKHETASKAVPLLCKTLTMRLTGEKDSLPPRQ